MPKTEYPTTYEPGAQRMHIQVGKGGPVTTVTPIHPDILIECDRQGNLIGIEITGPGARALYQSLAWGQK